MIGAGVLAILDLLKIPNYTGQIPTLVAGFITAAIVGYLAIQWLLSYLSKRSLYLFAAYSVVVPTIVVIFYLARL